MPEDTSPGRCAASAIMRMHPAGGMESLMSQDLIERSIRSANDQMRGAGRRNPE